MGIRLCCDTAKPCLRFRRAAFISPWANSLASGARVTIIESTSANTGHTQDPAWASVAAAEGFVAGIYPQSTLETTAFFGTSDILVISSGMIGLTATAASSIDAFLISQRP